MKSFKPLPLMLVLMFMLFPIITILMTHHITLSETLSNMDSGALGKEYTMISFQNQPINSDALYAAAGRLGTSIAVYADSELANRTKVRSIFFTRTYVNLPMRRGRFFRQEDFTPNRYTAVIGKGLADQIKIKDSTSWITVNGIDFEVLGVIGYEKETVWDNTVFINGYAQSAVFQPKVYTLDFMSGDAEKLTQALLADLRRRDGIDGKVLTGSKSFLSGFLPRMLYARWFVVILMCNTISIGLLSNEWMRRKKIEFSIKRMVGASPSRLFGGLCLRYSVMLLIALGCSMLYCTVFYPAYWQSLLIGFLLFLPLAFLFLFGSAWLILRTPIGEGLNECR